jgi:hypothetical protein
LETGPLVFEAVLLPETRSLLKKLQPQALPEKTYLAGGTAIALQLGHRRSADLDLFTSTQFVETQWESKLSQDLGFKLLKRDWQTLIGSVDKVKFSLFGYFYPMMGPLEIYENIPVASLQDLGAMKLQAIIGRGTKRDFIDIYFLALKFGMKNLFSFYQQKYGDMAERELMLKKSLVYFEDAETDEMPNMLTPTKWLDVKRWFTRSIRKLSA